MKNRSFGAASPEAIIQDRIWAEFVHKVNPRPKPEVRDQLPSHYKKKEEPKQ